jgi:hypothetical protein
MKSSVLGIHGPWERTIDSNSGLMAHRDCHTATKAQTWSSLASNVVSLASALRLFLLSSLSIAVAIGRLALPLSSKRAAHLRHRFQQLSPRALSSFVGSASTMVNSTCYSRSGWASVVIIARCLFGYPYWRGSCGSWFVPLVLCKTQPEYSHFTAKYHRFCLVQYRRRRSYTTNAGADSKLHCWTDYHLSYVQRPCIHRAMTR